MLFRRTSVLRTAYDELLVVGSRWTRLHARRVETETAAAAAASGAASGAQSTSEAAAVSSATPYITIIPTLHVASVRFYDRVLEYMQQAVRRNKSTVILLEGICDSEEAEMLQMQEYADIAKTPELQEAMVSKADSNALYPPEVMADICRELALDPAILAKYADTVRLQECYLKPKMAALCGSNLRNNADLDMKEVQRLLEAESARLQTLGESLPASISVVDIGTFPVVRKQRERKVATVARLQCEKWLSESIEGEVIVPWGYFHCSAISHYILEGEAAASASGKTPVVFVEADELLAKVPFGVPKELVQAAEEQTNAAKTTESTEVAKEDNLDVIT